MTELSVEPAAFDSAEVQRLVTALDAELGALYPPEQRFGPNFKLQHAAPGRGAFFLARVAGEPVGCGGCTLLDPATAEVKRMFVAPELRGRGVARAVLEQIEEAARALGATRLVLETGIHQQEANRLYEGAGFTRLDCWGEYAGSATSICYEKPLELSPSAD